MFSPERYWFIEVGPFDEAQAVAWVEALGDRLEQEQTAELIDNRQLFARASDVETVRKTQTVLRAGLASAEIANEVRRTAAAVVEDMEVWLDREYDPGRGRSGAV